MTVGNLVEWIMENRSKGAFRGYSKDKITQEIDECIKNNCFDYSLDKDGKFNGVVCGAVDNENMTFMCYDVLTTEKGVIRKFMNTFLNLYPNHRITGTVRNRGRNFNNPVKLTNRLT